MEISYKQLWKNLEMIRRNLSLDDLGFAKLIEISPRELKTKRSKEQSISLDSAYNLTSKLDLSFEDLFSNNLKLKNLVSIDKLQ